MADKKISELTDGVPAQPGDLIPVARAGTNVRVTPQSVVALAPPPDPWANYGTPLWRTDFTSAASLNDWDVISGSPLDKSNAVFNSTVSPGMWVDHTGTSELWLRRASPTVAYVYDVRIVHATPDRYTAAGLGVSAGVMGSTSATAVRTWGGFTSSTGLFSVLQLNARNYSTVTTAGAALFGNTVNDSVWDAGITFRIYYNGASVWRTFWCVNSPYVSVRRSLTQIAAFGTSTHVVLQVSSKLGAAVRVKFAQMMTSGIDDLIPNDYV
jgi:hypothetical protein